MQESDTTDSQHGIAIRVGGGKRLNGLGMMLKQYLEQNFTDFEHKVKQGHRIRGRVAVEVEKGIAITIGFLGKEILIENGVTGNPDLYLKSSYLVLADVLSGKASPFLEVVYGNIKLKAFPRRPLQSLRVLRFLKIPPELLLEPGRSYRSRYILWAMGGALGATGLALLIYHLIQIYGG